MQYSALSTLFFLYAIIYLYLGLSFPSDFPNIVLFDYCVSIIETGLAILYLYMAIEVYQLKGKK